MWGELAPPRPPRERRSGARPRARWKATRVRRGRGPGAELAVRGHAQPVGGQPLLHGGTAWLRSPCCTASIPRRPAAGRVALPSSPGRHMEAVRTGARRLGASTIRPEPRYMPTLGQGEPHRHRRRRPGAASARRCPTPALPATSGTIRAASASHPSGTEHRRVRARRWRGGALACGSSPSRKEPPGTGARAAKDEHRTESSTWRQPSPEDPVGLWTTLGTGPGGRLPSRKGPQ
jgi:hypothetical protein